MPVRRSNKPPPPGYDKIEPVIEALENELRDKVKESNLHKRNAESIWPVHQINHQRSRYIYDMYYTHNQISKRLYEYCLRMKLADAGLIAKWKKPGYERLCSTYVINPVNYKFGTTSICRVPIKDRGENAKAAQDPTTGCLGCASGKGQGELVSNIFGNKYGQNLAAVQVARDKRRMEIEAKNELERLKRLEREQEEVEDEDEAEDEAEEQEQEQPIAASASATAHVDQGESETDDNDDTDDEEDTDDEDDYGPSPAAGVWAGSKKLEAASEAIAEGDQDNGDGDGDNGDGESNSERPHKKLRAE